MHGICVLRLICKWTWRNFTAVLCQQHCLQIFVKNSGFNSTLREVEGGVGGKGPTVLKGRLRFFYCLLWATFSQGGGVGDKGSTVLKGRLRFCYCLLWATFSLVCIACTALMFRWAGLRTAGQLIHQHSRNQVRNFPNLLELEHKSKVIKSSGGMIRALRWFHNMCIGHYCSVSGMVWLYSHLSSDEEIGLSSIILKILFRRIKGTGWRDRIQTCQILGLNRNFCSFFYSGECSSN